MRINDEARFRVGSEGSVMLVFRSRCSSNNNSLLLMFLILIQMLIICCSSCCSICCDCSSRSSLSGIGIPRIATTGLCRRSIHFLFFGTREPSQQKQKQERWRIKRKRCDCLTTRKQASLSGITVEMSP